MLYHKKIILCAESSTVIRLYSYILQRKLPSTIQRVKKASSDDRGRPRKATGNPWTLTCRESENYLGTTECPAVSIAPTPPPNARQSFACSATQLYVSGFRFLKEAVLDDHNGPEACASSKTKTLDSTRTYPIKLPLHACWVEEKNAAHRR